MRRRMGSGSLGPAYPCEMMSGFWRYYRVFMMIRVQLCAV